MVPGSRETLSPQIDVNGGSTSPVWKFLKGSDAKGAGDDVGWNFAAKFIIDKVKALIIMNTLMPVNEKFYTSNSPTGTP
jgi:glutathione peroxidase-family protein